VNDLDVGVITAIVALVGTALSGVIGYATGRGKDKMTERELLSKDEQSFRAELREELRTYKDEIKRLSDEITILRTENMELINENRVLNGKLEQLVKQLSGRRGDEIGDAKVPS
jgi:predicted RNase H-like nuclease (RuvC/YqgF family)